MSDIEVITDSSFEKATQTGLVLVDFYADWCGPCRMLHPILVELAAEYDGRIKITKVNIDHSPRIAGQFGITSIPTMLLFKDGKVVEQIVGLKDKNSLTTLLNAH